MWGVGSRAALEYPTSLSPSGSPGSSAFSLRPTMHKGCLALARCCLGRVGEGLRYPHCPFLGRLPQKPQRSLGKRAVWKPASRPLLLQCSSLQAQGLHEIPATQPERSRKFSCLQILAWSALPAGAAFRSSHGLPSRPELPR